MTPEDFISKWKSVEVIERAAARSHFIDLCHLLGEPTPVEADPDGKWYAFEKDAPQAPGGNRWADVWKRGCFAWQYTRQGQALNAALIHLRQTALALENPPLLIVSDIERIMISTNWTDTVSETLIIGRDDLRTPETRELLRAALSRPEKLRPGRTRQELTEAVAAELALLARRLREEGHSAAAVAHFAIRLVFCLFAEDIDLLPNKMFRRLLDASLTRPDHFPLLARALFGAMRAGSTVGIEPVAWFNGGLFDDNTILPMSRGDVELAIRVADLDWAEIDPSIFGTLFERALDPDKGSQLGALYTGRDEVNLVIDAAVVQPLSAEWDAVKRGLLLLMAKVQAAESPGDRAKAEAEARRAFGAFLDRLRSFRVLDPACGSGNFLSLSLLALKDLEHRVSLEAEEIDARVFPREVPRIGPASVLGIEMNAYGAELARVVVWIGDIQWMRRNGFDVSRDPVLKPLDGIECRDALLNPDGTEAEWPDADVIVANPPFLDGTLMRPLLGDGYVEPFFRAYAGRVPPESDLGTYWVAKAWDAIRAGRCSRAGLVTANAIRGGANRRVLDVITEEGAIYEAWSDEAWVVDGAAARVCIICFGPKDTTPSPRLDGNPVSKINPDLTAG